MLKIQLSYSDGVMIEQVLRDRATECRGYADKYPANARAFMWYLSEQFDAMADRFEQACEAWDGDEG